MQNQYSNNNPFNARGQQHILNIHNYIQPNPFNASTPNPQLHPYNFISPIPSSPQKIHEQPQGNSQGRYFIPHLPNHFSYFVNPHGNSIINPEWQESRADDSKMGQIDELNKSVKSIMKRNEQYREQLLSAYQHKSKMHLQNVILAKEKENLQAEKETLSSELEQANRKLFILQNYSKKSIQNNKKICLELRKQAEELHQRLKCVPNIQYELKNKCNENKLLLQQNNSLEVKIKELTLNIQMCQQAKEELKGGMQELKRQNNIFIEQKQYLCIQKQSYQQQIFQKDNSLHKLQEEVKHLRQHLDSFIHQCSDIKHKYQQAKDLALYQEKQMHSLSETIKLWEIENKELKNDLKHKQLQTTQLKVLVQQMKKSNTNIILSQCINRKDVQIQHLSRLCSQITLQFNQLSQSHRNLEQKLHSQSINLLEQTHLIHSNKNEIQRLNLLLQQQQQQRGRINKVIHMKQKVVQQKEAIICQQINEIIALQTKLSQQSTSNAHQQQIIAYLQQKLKFTEAQLQNSLTTIANNSNLIIELERKQTLDKEMNEKAIANVLNEIQQLKICHKKDLDKQIVNNQNLENQIVVLKEELKASLQIVNIKQKLIDEYKGEIDKIRKLHQSLKGEMLIVQAQYQTLEDTLKEKSKQQNQTLEQLQSSMIQKEKNKKQLQQLRANLVQQHQKNKQLQQQLVQIGYQLNIYKSGLQRQIIKSQTLQSFAKIVQHLERVAHQLQIDPKICITRFTSLINSTHRQPFTRQAQKLKAFLTMIDQLSKEILTSAQLLKLHTSFLSHESSPHKIKSQRLI